MGEPISCSGLGFPPLPNFSSSQLWLGVLCTLLGPYPSFPSFVWSISGSGLLCHLLPITTYLWPLDPVLCKVTFLLTQMNTPDGVLRSIHVPYPGQVIILSSALEDMVNDGTFPPWDRLMEERLLLTAVITTTDTIGKTLPHPLSH